MSDAGMQTDLECASDERVADALGDLLAAGYPDGSAPSTEAHWSGRDQFVRAVRRPAPARWPRVALAALVLVCCGLGAWALLDREDAPVTPAEPTADALRWAVEGAVETDSSGRIVARGAAALDFTDGSRVELAPATSLTIAESRADGVDIQLDAGAIALDVVHAETTAWSVRAGDVVVDVVGTRFEVATAGDEVTVVLFEGAVEVSTAATSPVRLSAGHTLVARDGRFSVAPTVRTRAMQTAPEAPGETAGRTHGEPAEGARADAASGPAPVVPEPGRIARVAEPEPILAVEPPSPREARTSRPVGETWPDLVAAGDFDAVVAEARAIGERRAVRKSERAALVALSEAARFSGESDLAETSLHALRDRFPSTSDAAMAAFVLGRLAESGGSRGVAADWYARYRDEAPLGALVDEALGREMATRSKLGQDQRAAALAARYLEQHPNGAYARAASSILER